MKKIIYFEPSDAEEFKLERFENSLKEFAEVPKVAIKEALVEFENYESLHVSRLVEAGVTLIAKYGDEVKAKAYFEQNNKYFGEKFERLRRITGYLVGTLDRWNDGKKAEESARVKHSVNSAIDDSMRMARLEEQALAHNVAYAA